MNKRGRCFGVIKKYAGFLCVQVALVLFTGGVVTAYAEDGNPASMDELSTCAVYHRMLAAALRRDRDLPEMARLEQEKMDHFVARAKTAAGEEYGEELAEEMFLDAWRANIEYMTDQINRNYENVRRLKSRYGNRCRKLYEGTD